MWAPHLMTCVSPISTWQIVLEPPRNRPTRSSNVIDPSLPPPFRQIHHVVGNWAPWFFMKKHMHQLSGWKSPNPLCKEWLLSSRVVTMETQLLKPKWSGRLWLSVNWHTILLRKCLFLPIYVTKKMVLHQAEIKEHESNTSKKRATPHGSWEAKKNDIFWKHLIPLRVIPHFKVNL